MSVFLPKVATLQQAIDWMNDATGQQWTLARLIEETAIMPWVWLDYSPDAPPEIFRGRLEGYLAPMLFNGDTLRLAAGADDVVITMTETADGQLVQMVGMRCQLSELRFKREDLEENARILSRPAEPEDVGETLADNSRVWKKNAMVAELKGIWPSITRDLSEASREKGELKAANVRRGYWNLDMCIKWAVAHGKITNNQQLKNYVIEKDDSPFAALLKTLFKI